MRDCPNVTMRERLPDLLHDRLSAAERAEVHAHLNTCADCRAELKVLESVRALSVSQRVDTRRILSALPSYRAVPRWRRVLGSPLVQIAAALFIVAGGAFLLSGRRLPNDPAISPQVVVVPKADSIAVEPDTSLPSSPLRRQPSLQQPTTELAVGELFDDLTDGELEALLAAFNSLETLTPVETEVVVPAVNRGGT